MANVRPRFFSRHQGPASHRSDTKPSRLEHEDVLQSQNSKCSDRPLACLIPANPTQDSALRCHYKYWPESPHLSFPRRRESRFSNTAKIAISWIPVFTGMTITSLLFYEWAECIPKLSDYIYNLPHQLLIS